MADAKSKSGGAKPTGAKSPAGKASTGAKHDPAKPAAESADPCVTAGIPGPEHEVLKVFEGKWKATVSFWMQPGAAPMHAEGAMANEWILGGRFLQQRYTSNFLGSPFAGQGMFGYNNVDRRYEGLWADTMSTAMMLETGRYDASLRTFTMTGEVTEPGSRKIMRKKTVITIDSPDQHTMAMHFADDGAKSFWKCMEIVYTKV
jgi:hypothetical protein